MIPKVNFLHSITRDLGILRPVREYGELQFIFHNNQTNVIAGRHNYGRVHVFSYQKGGSISIGNFNSISEIVLIMGGNHHLGITTYPLKTKFLGFDTSLDNGDLKGIVIGNDCWIGLNSTILDGVTIETGSIIGAGSVITKSTEPYGIYAGNPARKIGVRFSESCIEKLLSLKWWEQPDHKIISNIDSMYEDDCEKFIQKFKYGEGK